MATTAGAATAKAEDDKARQYAGCYSLATSTLICVAVESFGRIGLQAEKLLDELAIHKASSEIGIPGTHAGIKSGAKARLRQLLSVALQTALSERELGYARLLRAAGPQAAASMPVEELWDAGDWPALGAAGGWGTGLGGGG